MAKTASMRRPAIFIAHRSQTTGCQIVGVTASEQPCEFIGGQKAIAHADHVSLQDQAIGQRCRKPVAAPDPVDRRAVEDRNPRRLEPRDIIHAVDHQIRAQ